MIANIIAWILIALMTFWIIGSVVSIFKAVKKKLCGRRVAASDAQNKNDEKESDQSNSEDSKE